MAVVPNPFTLTYDALWELVWQHPITTELVKPGNRANYAAEDDRKDPVKKDISSNDLPEIVLLSQGITGGNLHATSSTSMVQRRYQFVITTGDFRLHPILHQIEWGLLCALADWKRVLTALQWNGYNFVKKCQLGDVTEGILDPQKNRGITGWSAVWAADLEMHFATADLKAEMEP